MNLKSKDLRANPSQKRLFDAEQVTNTKVLQHAMGSRSDASLLTQANGALGKDPPRSIPT